MRPTISDILPLLNRSIRSVAVFLAWRKIPVLESYRGLPIPSLWLHGSGELVGSLVFSREYREAYLRLSQARGVPHPVWGKGFLSREKEEDACFEMLSGVFISIAWTSLLGVTLPYSSCCHEEGFLSGVETIKARLTTTSTTKARLAVAIPLPTY